MSEEILDDTSEENDDNGYLEKRFRPLWIILPVLILASIFRVMNWPSKVLLLIIGLSLLCAHSVTLLIFLKKNESFTNIGAASLICGIIYYISNEYTYHALQVLGIVVVLATAGFYFLVRGK